jgi:hypothetical protein
MFRISDARTGMDGYSDFPRTDGLPSSLAGASKCAQSSLSITATDTLNLGLNLGGAGTADGIHVARVGLGAGLGVNMALRRRADRIYLTAPRRQAGGPAAAACAATARTARKTVDLVANMLGRNRGNGRLG